jgi:hypothetical protein
MSQADKDFDRNYREEDIYIDDDSHDYDTECPCADCVLIRLER